MTARNKGTSRQATSTMVEPAWAEEWVPMKSIIKHGPLQVRFNLDKAALKRYAGMTKAGSTPPPIKVGRVGEALYLVDGWHRMESGSLRTMRDTFAGGEQVLCQVATMTEDEVRWQAARANLGHGVRLKTREMRGVFKAFIKAKKHKLPKGKLMSYREMGAALGVGHTTLRTWMLKDFPALARTLGGDEHGNGDATCPPLEVLALEQEHAMEAQRALGTLMQHAKALGCPVARWELLEGLEEAAGHLRTLGVEQPEPSPF